MLFAFCLLLLSGLACKYGSSSPTATFKDFYDAQKKKDVAAIKKTLSKASLDMMEKAAKEQKKTVDEALKEGLESPAAKAEKAPPTRNEKIDGNNATLEVQDEESKKWVDQILGIYQMLKKEAPKEGEEPPPLPFKKQA